MHGDFGGGGSHSGHDFGGGHHVGGSHHISGDQHHHDGPRDDNAQVIPLFGRDGSRSGRLRSRVRGGRGLIGDAIIILVAVFVVVAIATMIFH